MRRSRDRVASKGQSKFRYFVSEETNEAVMQQVRYMGQDEEDLLCSSLLTVC